jgi:hypothetical protein
MVMALLATFGEFENSGTFVIFHNEEQIGSQESVWKAGGCFESHSRMQVAGQNIPKTYVRECAAHVYHDLGHRSGVLLPVVPGTRR